MNVLCGALVLADKIYAHSRVRPRALDDDSSAQLQAQPSKPQSQTLAPDASDSHTVSIAIAHRSVGSALAPSITPPQNPPPPPPAPPPASPSGTGAPAVAPTPAANDDGVSSVC